MADYMADYMIGNNSKVILSPEIENEIAHYFKNGITTIPKISTTYKYNYWEQVAVIIPLTGNICAYNCLYEG